MPKHTKGHLKDFKNLDEWLCYLETIHNTEIDLGLSRIRKVAKHLNIDFSFACVITVAGTNGKGTTCAFLENALLGETLNEQVTPDQKQSVAVYSSPHIEHFNERLRINKCDIDDKSLINAFEQIELARKDISLSYYEYTTLAAFLVLMAVKPEVIILEVGLGGRLDATNIIDANVAVITSIDIDHQAFLGNNRETIGFEKAGIMRANQHVIIGDPDAPCSVLDHANNINNLVSSSVKEQENNKIKVRNKNFSTRNYKAQSWQWQCFESTNKDDETLFCLNNLVKTHIPQDNVATALMVLKQLGVTLTSAKVNAIIEQTKVAGRTELFKRHTFEKNEFKGNDLKDNKAQHQCDVMLDVGHNPHAGRYLAKKLTLFKTQNQYHKIIAVVAMLADKDINNTLSPLSEVIDEWYVAPLAIPKAASSEQMIEALTRFTNSINCFDNITQAFKIAVKKAKSDDLILVFGSFYTVAEIRKLLI